MKNSMLKKKIACWKTLKKNSMLSDSSFCWWDSWFCKLLLLKNFQRGEEIFDAARRFLIDYTRLAGARHGYLPVSVSQSSRWIAPTGPRNTTLRVVWHQDCKQSASCPQGWLTIILTSVTSRCSETCSVVNLPVLWKTTSATRLRWFQSSLSISDTYQKSDRKESSRQIPLCQMKIQIKTQEFMKAPPEPEMMMWLMVGEVLDVPEVIQGTVVRSEEWRGSDPPPTSADPQRHGSYFFCISS